jgi:WD40 repeat protein
MNRLFLGIALLLAWTINAYAQVPSDAWRTIETRHFRVHYPAEYEAWATRAAERLEPIHAAVSKEVGFTPAQRIDVLVMNPVAEPNGSAWPFLDTPRIIFWAEPPGPDEQLGAYGTWIELLAVHEVAHVVHMLRPSRNGFERLIEKSVLPLNPITLHAPRWVLEGYATVVEGRLTGAGRPSSTIRALILRQWAENGRLPTYGQLSSDQRFLGMSMAYLMGSAFLEWLEQRNGPDSLRNLWARMTARQRRSFESAFTGVFGERPDRLYGQFLAEVTASAVAVKHARMLQQGALFQETPRASGNPTVSPDGSQLAVVIRNRDEPEKLVVWSTAAADEEEKKYRERIEKILGRDPEDVPPLRTKPLPRTAKHELVMPDGGDIQNPRWSRDGKSTVFAHRVPDADGVLHFDLYRWDFAHVTRITRFADVRDADFVDDNTMIAVHSAYGLTQLVNVDLRSGTVSSRATRSRASARDPLRDAIERVVASPRVSSDGRIAYVAHQDARWTLFVDDQPIALPGDAATPAWLSNDGLIVTVFERGFAELYRVNGSTATPITRTGGGAFDPAPSNDGRVFFMSLEPDGYVVRVLDKIEDAPPAPALEASLVPTIPPIAAASVTLGSSEPPSAPRRYGIGRQEPAWFASVNLAPQQQAIEAGLRFGDVVGRLDTLLIASLAREDAPEGIALASAWRGWPVEVHAHAFHTDTDNGGELRAIYSRRLPQSRVTFEAGASDDLVFGSAAFATFQRFGSSRIDETIRIDADDDHWRATAAASFKAGSLQIGARYQHDDGATVALGGLPSSILPRSAYAHRILDPALPVAIMSGDEYDGWRIEARVPGLPLTAFYQRHDFGAASLALAGAELVLHSAPNPIVKVPGLDLTLGAAHILDAPLKGETKFWMGMRWRP